MSIASSPLLSSPPPRLLLPDLNHDHPLPVFPAGPQPRLSTPSVPCRTSTTIIHAQCSLPDVNGDHPRPVFRAGPQPRPSTHSVPCWTPTATIHALCPLPHLNRNHPRPVIPAGPQHDHPRPVFPAGPQPRPFIVLATRNNIFYRCHRFWKCCENLTFFSFFNKVYNPFRLRRNMTSKPSSWVRTPGVLYIPTSEWSYNPSLRESLALAS